MAFDGAPLWSQSTTETVQSTADCSSDSVVVILVCAKARPMYIPGILRL